MNIATDTHDLNGQPAPPPPSPQRTMMRLPGLVAIGLYLLLLAGTDVFGVVTGHFEPLYLVFPVFFIAAAAGLMLLLRWAWALALATMALLSAIFMYNYFRQHEYMWLMQGLLNLVFFLYLVRTDVREKLR